MSRFLCSTLCLLGLAMLATPAQAQVYYSTYYVPAYAPTMVAPTTVYYPSVNRVTSYYAPTTTVLPGTAYTTLPVTSYMAPVASPLPLTTYYAPTPVTSYYAPTAVTAYYAPAVTPVYVGRPAIVRSTVYYPGQPIRNTLRAIGF